MDYGELGRQVAQIRKEKAWSQQQLADYAAISRPTLSAFENGRSGEMGLRKLLVILDLLGLSIKLVEKRSRPTLEDLLDEQ